MKYQNILHTTHNSVHKNTCIKCLLNFSVYFQICSIFYYSWNVSFKYYSWATVYHFNCIKRFLIITLLNSFQTWHNHDQLIIAFILTTISMKLHTFMKNKKFPATLASDACFHIVPATNKYISLVLLPPPLDTWKLHAQLLQQSFILVY